MVYVLMLLGGMFIGSFVVGIVLCVVFYIGAYVLFLGSVVWAIFKFILSPFTSLLRKLFGRRRTT